MVMWVMGLWIGNARPWARGCQRLMDARAHVGLGIGHDQVLGGQVVVVLGVGRRALEDAGDVAGGRLRHEPQEGGGLLDALALDRAGDEPGLSRGAHQVLGCGGNAHVLAPT